MFHAGISLFCILLATNLWADCAPDYRSDKKSGVFIKDVAISGTTSLSSADLLKIRSKFTGACVDEDTDDLNQLVRIIFQNEGYYQAEVKNIDTHVLDALERPKPINLEAEVVEGHIFKFGEVTWLEIMLCKRQYFATLSRCQRERSSTEIPSGTV